jgi:hypothetical protein
MSVLWRVVRKPLQGHERGAELLTEYFALSRTDDPTRIATPATNYFPLPTELEWSLSPRVTYHRSLNPMHCIRSLTQFSQIRTGTKHPRPYAIRVEEKKCPLLCS